MDKTGRCSTDTTTVGAVGSDVAVEKRMQDLARIIIQRTDKILALALNPDQPCTDQLLDVMRNRWCANFQRMDEVVERTTVFRAKRLSLPPQNLDVNLQAVGVRQRLEGPGQARGHIIGTQGGRTVAFHGPTITGSSTGIKPFIGFTLMLVEASPSFTVPEH